MRGTLVQRLGNSVGGPSAPQDTGNASRPNGEDEVAPRCVFVIGMHRSGTSATTGALGRLGLESPSAAEMVPATKNNERGHYEAKTLVRFNEGLLSALGGTWSAPPTLEPGWEHDPSLDALRPEAAERFDAVFPAPDSFRSAAAWKDPRNCILLPFWRTVLGPGTAAVLVYRDPVEVARSLAGRNGFRLTLGLALWERHVRAACANLDGVPTLCTDFRRVTDDPQEWCRQAADFLSKAGVDVDPTGLAGAADSVDETLRHQRGDDNAPSLSGEPRRILDVLRRHEGPHHPWRAPDLGPEAPWVAEVLAMQRQVDLLGRAERSVLSSRAQRLATAVGRRRGRAS